LLKMPVSTAILVDSMYLQHVAKEYGIEQIDIRRLPKVLLREAEEHYMTYYFDALPYVSPSKTPDEMERHSKKKGFITAMQYAERIRVELGDVRPKWAKCPKCGTQFYVPVQKLVDVKISVRLVSLACSEKIKKIILVAGDKDLLPAVEVARDAGTIIRLAYAEIGHAQTSRDLIKACSEKHKLTEADIAPLKWVP